MEHKLAIFDVDGTLCDTYDVDAECFMQVAAEILGNEIYELDWQLSPHPTDMGILNWFWHERKGRLPTTSEVNTFRNRFVLALKKQLQINPIRFREIQGAQHAVDYLLKSEWDVTIGTGSWKHSALLKLEAIGLPKRLLLSTSEDSYDRVKVFGLAKIRSEDKFSKKYNRIVLIGDGVWDVSVAATMNWPFVGIGNGNCAFRLRVLGASSVFENYTDIYNFMKALNNCVVPARAG